MDAIAFQDKDIFIDSIFVDVSSRIDECNQNKWTISFSTDEIQIFDKGYFLSKLYTIIINRHTQIIDRNLDPMIFYCWFDELGGYFAFSLTSNPNLPLLFESKLNYVKDIRVIIDHFYKAYDQSIDTYSEQDDNKDEYQDEFTLDVFTIILNKHEFIELI
jgi:hypothetical protein